MCALIGPELGEQVKNVDFAVLQQEFDKYSQDKRMTKKLASKYDFFIAQSTIMPKVASVFGRVLGPKGKMPNPKAGCVVPPNASLKALYERLQNTVKLSAKKITILQSMIGNEESKEEDVLENIKYIYNNVVHQLPQGENNVKSVFIKYTMGKPVKIL